MAPSGGRQRAPAADAGAVRPDGARVGSRAPARRWRPSATEQRARRRAAAGDPVPPTYVASLDTGAVDAARGPDLATPRTDASVTPFGDGALVAGGRRTTGRCSRDAEVYSTAARRLRPTQTIALSGPRTQHGAVVLASGQTLLVGGLGSTDGDERPRARWRSSTRSLEQVDRRRAWPRSRRREANPTVLRLASGEILVAGGVDGARKPGPDARVVQRGRDAVADEARR